MRRVLACVVVLTGVLACGACTSRDEPENAPSSSVDAVRQAVTDAGPAPEKCPVVDVPAAVRSAGVEARTRLESATAEVSQSEEPAADPLAAQQQGTPPLEASAGANIECHHLVGEDELDVYLVATRSEGAVNLLAPLIVSESGMAVADLQDFLGSLPGPGEVAMPADTVAVVRPDVDGGDAALMVVSDLGGDVLREVTGTLGTQVG